MVKQILFCKTLLILLTLLFFGNTSNAQIGSTQLLDSLKNLSPTDSSYCAYCNDTVLIKSMQVKMTATKETSGSGFSIGNADSRNGYGQFLSTPNYAPASPTASSLGAYGESQVDLYTGRPIINIPIYELKGKDISIPISLSYNAGGVKVNDLPSWVGSNWALNAGGVITRNMRGRPDEEANNGYFAKIGMLTTSDENIQALSNSDFDKFSDGQWDSQPDEFYFNFDGNTGKIIFDRYKIPRVYPYSKYKVDVTIESNQIKQFCITTTDGTKYYFGKGPNSIERSRSIQHILPVDFKYIVGPVNSPSISAGQTAPQYATFTNENRQIFDYWGFIQRNYYYEKASITYNSAWYLSEKVIASGEKLLFSYENDGWILYRSGIYESYSCNNVWRSGCNSPGPNCFSFIDLPDFSRTGKVDRVEWRNDPSCNCNKYFLVNSCAEYPHAFVPDDCLQLFIKSFDNTNTTDDVLNVTVVWIENEIKRLTRISTDQGNWVDFKATHQRQDISSNYIKSGSSGGKSWALTSVEINDFTGKNVKKFIFEYDYMISKYLHTLVPPRDNNGNDVELDYETKRLFLHSLTEVANGVSLPPYIFTYYGTLPRRCSPFQDYMGYYNNNGNIFRFKTYVKGDGNIAFPLANNFSNTNYKLGATSLEPVLSHAKIGSLIKIKYPANGETLYNYELHKIKNENNKELYFPGLRINSIENYEGNILVGKKEYFYIGDDGMSSGKIPYSISLGEYYLGYQFKGSDGKYLDYSKHNLTSYNLSTTHSEYIGYSKVTEVISGFGKKEFYFYAPNTISDANTANVRDKEETGYLYDGSPFPPKRSLSHRRGLLNKLVEWDESGVKVKETEINYNLTTGLSTNIIGVLMTTRDYNDTKKRRRFGWDHNLTEWVHPVKKRESVYDKEKNLWITNETEMSFNSLNLLQNEIRQWQSDGTLLKQKIKYVSDLGSECEQLQECISLAENSKKDCIDECMMISNVFARASCLNSCNTVYNSEVNNCYTTIDPNRGCSNIVKDEIVFQKMKTKNMISLPIEEQTIKQIGGQDYLISGNLIKYKEISNNIIVPSEIYSIDQKEPSKNFSQVFLDVNDNLVFNSNYRMKHIFDNYDDKGNLLLHHAIGDINTAYIWGYNKSKLFAEIKNAKTTEVYFNGFEESKLYSYDKHSGKYCARINNTNQYIGVVDFFKGNLTSSKYVYSGWFKTTGNAILVVKDLTDNTPWLSKSITNTGGVWKYFELEFDVNDPIFNGCSTIRCEVYTTSTTDVLVDDLRFKPLNSMMTTYTYAPLIGMTSKTDENNRTTYYEYDDFGRLKTVKDDDGNILNHYQYRYHEVNFSLSNTLTGNNSYRFDITGDDIKSPSLSFEWNFGDGQSAATTSPTTTHTYSSSSGANYTVTVTVKSNGNIVKTLTTTVNSLGECTLSAMHLSDCDYQLRITGSNFNGSNYTYEWNMGDGTVLNNNLWTMPYTFNATQTLNTYNVSVKIKYQGTVIRTLQTTVRCGLLEPDPRELLPI